MKWQFPADAPVYGSIAVGAEDNVHIGSANGKVYTVDTDGQLVWTFDTDSEVMSSPSVGPDGRERSSSPSTMAACSRLVS